ncbi:hypothetical protein N7520_007546 [Penicillium odoratum]|uniref:uncharacterized protein n=1 Tax=Penicillium odoratum TaxID=1167516 RepID=UPI002548F85D|nr:uncharacterized protein N7520_007546 [Penicillium odoratum]KAJ5760390.1 hypothetical protein N7520_007546 [Penicillium odoratum]
MSYHDPRNVLDGGNGNVTSSISPLSGKYVPNRLKALYYGPDVVKSHLLSCLPTETSKAFIVTGNSLANKTPLIKGLESLLSKHHAGTYSGITEHSPQTQVEEVASRLNEDPSIDTIISVGGGSPMDSAKNITYVVHEATGRWLSHITIPTTLSAGECTPGAGFTRADGVKGVLVNPALYPDYILYDPKFGVYTPPRLFLSTGIRALDHAVESQYHQSVTYIPSRIMALSAITELFRLLPEYEANPKDEDTITALFLAAYASLGFFGQNMGRGLGLSHRLGYALGSPYGIPHGITSCITLGHVVKLQARQDEKSAGEIAAILPYIGEKRSGNDVEDSDLVGNRILGLVQQIGLKTDLTIKGVGKNQVDVICARATRLEVGEKTIEEPRFYNSASGIISSAAKISAEALKDW